MRPFHPFLRAGATLLALLASAFAADTVTYNDQVKPIFLANCFKCHNADKAKGGLDLTSLSAVLQGGSSGAVVEPGNPDGSRLFRLMTHAEEPFMPKDSPPRPKEELELVKRWIAGGLVERAGGEALKGKPRADLRLASAPTTRPQGPPPMPRELLLEPLLFTARADVAGALAASPWAPLVALGGQKQVFLYQSDTLQLLGVLPFCEGVPRSLKFSRNGKLLLCGGGTPGKFGRVVVWDVTTGDRAIEVGEEYDTVLAADINADQSLIALGGPDKQVKVFSTATGERLQLHKKHTDWITAVEYSPDGVLLATGDRSGGLVVWEAQSGQEFYVLNGHQGPITGLDWRSDGNVLASASGDGTIKLWNVQDGSQIKSWAAHGDGVLSVNFARDGRLVSAGRDKRVRVWDGTGLKQIELNDFTDLVLNTVFSHDGKRIAIGAWNGEVRVVSAGNGDTLGHLDVNPPPLAQRIDRQFQQIAALEKKQPALAAAALTAEADANQKSAALAATRKEFQDAEKSFQTAETETANAQKTVAQAKADLDKAGTDLVALRDKLKAADERWKADEQRRAQAEAGVRQLQDKVAELLKAKESFDKALELAKADFASAATNDGKKAAATEAEKKVQSAVAELTGVQQKLSEATAALENLARTAAAAKTALEQTASPISVAETAVAQKKKTVDDVSAAAAQATGKLQPARVRKDELSKAVADREHTAAAARQAADTAAARKTGAEHDLAAARVELNRLKAGQLDVLLARVRQRTKEQGKEVTGLVALTETAGQAIDKIKFPQPPKPAANPKTPPAQPHPAYSFFGRFHIVVLHFPIAILLLVGLLEFYALIRPAAVPPRITGAILTLGAASALVTALLGLLLAKGGGYTGDELAWHKWLGIAAAGCAVVAVVVRARKRAYYAALLVTLVCLTAAAHKGGSLTHGDGFLTHYLPELLGKKTIPDNLADGTRQYAAIVKPILETRCYSCHGAAKQEGKFRLDLRAVVLKGGKSGQPAIVPGSALESELVRRITLPRADKDVMPPEEKSPLSPAEVVALIQWINTGAAWPDDRAPVVAAKEPARP